MAEVDDSVVNPPETGARAQTASQGVGSRSTESSGFEGTHKQNSDISTEEALAVLQTLVAKAGLRTEGVRHSHELSVQQGDEDQRRSLQQLNLQTLQNAIETANMVSKQAVRHADLAIDRQWNVDEQGYTAEQILGAPFVEALKAAVASAVSDTIVKK